MAPALPVRPLCLWLPGDPGVATLGDMTGQGEHCPQRTLESVSLLCQFAVSGVDVAKMSGLCFGVWMGA